MKTVKTFTNLAAAGFASSLLEACGIPALLADEQSYLMLPGNATGGIRLQVGDQDLERAVRVLKEGPDAPAASTVSAPSEAPETSENRSRIPVSVFVVAAVVLAFLAFAVHQFREQRRSVSIRPDYYRSEKDYNHDGEPDHFYTYLGGKIFKAEVDRNLDGKVDEWESFDREGRLEHVERDQNFDGRPDVWYFYENGSLVRSEQDTDFNGKPDWFSYYENGMLVRSDCRPNGSEVVVRRLIYKDGMLREEWVDEDQDGKFDYKILCDPFGNRSERIPLEPAK
jgi:hypothetical protein